MAPDDATEVTHTDRLPADVIYVSAKPSQGTCLGASRTITCHLGTLSKGETATVTIVITPTTVGTMRSTAFVKANEYDTDTGNNSDVEMTKVHFPNYSLTVYYGAGTGSGMVVSIPAGINCGVGCTGVFKTGTVVALTVTPASGSVFVHWKGDDDCSDGSLIIDADKNCIAFFNTTLPLINPSSNP